MPEFGRFFSVFAGPTDPPSSAGLRLASRPAPPPAPRRRSRPSPASARRRRRRRPAASSVSASSSACARLSSWSRWSVSSSVTSACGVLDDALDLLVDQPLRLRRGLAGAGEERALAVAGQQGDRPELVAHPPPADHLPRDLGQLLDVGLGAGGDLAVDDLLGRRGRRARP